MRENPQAAIARFHRSFPVADDLPAGLGTVRETWDSVVGTDFVWDGGRFAAILTEDTPFGRRAVDVTGTLERRGDGVDVSVQVEPRRETRTVALTIGTGLAGGVAAGLPVWLLAGRTFAFIAALLVLILAIAADVNAQRMATRGAERRLKNAAARFADTLAAGSADAPATFDTAS